MANLPESLFSSDPRPSSSSFGAGPSTSGANTYKASDHDQGDPSRAKILHSILDLNDYRTRERALYLLDKDIDDPSTFINRNLITQKPSNFRRTFQLFNVSLCSKLKLRILADCHLYNYLLFVFSQSRGSIREDLPLLLWNSFGTIYSLLKEILDVYRFISAQNLTQRASNRCVASHRDTRMRFIKARIPSYLFPLLNIENRERPYEHLRLTSLGVIGSLVKAGDAEAVSYLLENEIFIYCLRCMEVGGELSKTVATYIVQRIIINEEGLRYCCAFAQRFYTLSRALGNMLECRTAELPGKRLLKYIIYCYLRLSHNPRARDGLRTCLPASLRDPNLINLLRDDPTTVGFLQQLLYNVSMGHQYTVI
ncbi:cell differentiation protein rcd1-like isoform X2 [Juglans microcarpa x Juglans regia]|uniref:cell differentiation protein rcd1-like isoform X2 n=1 Tax=Juglans microcarpa x Juglans regia TaxID=2249226 RepID=UPI001B7E46A7|nr:cell differentiation protein rcd1-like isoform X2 [Juglans microcarpa x Juglans regia]